MLIVFRTDPVEVIVHQPKVATIAFDEGYKENKSIKYHIVVYTTKKNESQDDKTDRYKSVEAADDWKIKIVWRGKVHSGAQNGKTCQEILNTFVRLQEIRNRKSVPIDRAKHLTEMTSPDVHLIRPAPHPAGPKAHEINEPDIN